MQSAESWRSWRAADWMEEHHDRNTPYVLQKRNKRPWSHTVPYSLGFTNHWDQRWSKPSISEFPVLMAKPSENLMKISWKSHGENQDGPPPEHPGAERRNWSQLQNCRWRWYIGGVWKPRTQSLMAWLICFRFRGISKQEYLRVCLKTWDTSLIDWNLTRKNHDK